MTESPPKKLSFEEVSALPGCTPMMVPMRNREQFAAQYRDVDVKLRGPVSLKDFFEWLQYAKSVTVIPKMENTNQSNPLN